MKFCSNDNRLLIDRLTQVFGLIPAVLGIGALVGWMIDAPWLSSFGPDRIPMAPSTALLFILYGIGIFILVCAPFDKIKVRINLFVCSAGLFIALLLLILSSLGIHHEFEHLGIHISGTVKGAPLGYISPFTALCFVLSGISLVSSLFALSGRRWIPEAAFVAAALMVLINVVFFIAYLLGAPLLYGGAVIPPALSTCLSFLALGTALLMYSGQRIQTRGSGSDSSGARASYVLILIILVLTLGIIIAGFIYYRHYENHHRAEMEKYLAAIGNLKVNELVQWRKERLDDTAVITANQSFASHVQCCFETPEDVAIREPLLRYLAQIGTSYQYDQVCIVDTNGIIRLSVPETPDPVFVHSSLVSETLKSGRIDFLDFHRDVQDGPVHLAVLAPILSEGNIDKPLGILVLNIDPETYIYPTIQTWPVTTRSAETLLVRREGNSVLFLNRLRFKEDAALNLQIPLTELQWPAVRAALGRRGIVEGIDYRGVTVVASLHQVPGSPWSLVTKMDISEISAQMKEQMILVFMLIGALLLAGGTGVGLIWRQQRVRFFRQRYEAAEELRETESRFHSTLDNMLEGCQIIGFDWRYLYINEAAARYGHQSREELLGHKMMERYPGIENTAMFAELRRCMEERTAELTEHEFTYPDGAKAWFEFSIQPVSLGIFIRTLEITERKKAEDVIRQINADLERRVEERTTQLAASNKELEAFAYSVSHDLRAPLRAVDGFSRIVLEEYAEKLDDEGRRLLNIVRDNTQKMDQLITDLLALSQASRTDMKSILIDMTELAQAAYGEIAAPEVQELFEVSVARLPDAYGDPILLRQVWCNLLANAVKFTMKKETRSIEVRGYLENNTCVYFVRDNGAGFDPRYTHKLFGVFQRLHKAEEFEGTGIGLAIIHRIVHRHGGQVWAEGVPGEGATFYFSLPNGKNGYVVEAEEREIIHEEKYSQTE